MISVTPYSARQLVAHGPWIRGGKRGEAAGVTAAHKHSNRQGPRVTHTFRE